MKIVLLAVDWSLVRLGLVLVSMGVFTVIIETLVMIVFKFDRFSKSLVDSVMANIGSLLLGILLFLIFNKTEFNLSQRSELFVFYCIISIFEAFLIKLLKPKMGWLKILFTSFVMNLLSFVSLYIIFTKFLADFFSI
ncbi:MAG TPA: hypothetical protein VGG71_05720 [Chitinophagaceae bacterium]